MPTVQRYWWCWLGRRGRAAQRATRRDRLRQRRAGRADARRAPPLPPPPCCLLQGLGPYPRLKATGKGHSTPGRPARQGAAGAGRTRVGSVRAPAGGHTPFTKSPAARPGIAAAHLAAACTSGVSGCQRPVVRRVGRVVLINREVGGGSGRAGSREQRGHDALVRAQRRRRRRCGQRCRALAGAVCHLQQLFQSHVLRAEGTGVGEGVSAQVGAAGSDGRRPRGRPRGRQQPSVRQHPPGCCCTAQTRLRPPLSPGLETCLSARPQRWGQRLARRRHSSQRAELCGGGGGRAGGLA